MCPLYCQHEDTRYISSHSRTASYQEGNIFALRTGSRIFQSMLSYLNPFRTCWVALLVLSSHLLTRISCSMSLFFAACFADLQWVQNMLASREWSHLACTKMRKVFGSLISSFLDDFYSRKTDCPISFFFWRPTVLIELGTWEHVGFSSNFRI